MPHAACVFDSAFALSGRGSRPHRRTVLSRRQLPRYGCSTGCAKYAPLWVRVSGLAALRQLSLN